MMWYDEESYMDVPSSVNLHTPSSYSHTPGSIGGLKSGPGKAQGGRGSAKNA